MLQAKFLDLALEYLCFKPEIDLFATNTNTQFGNLGQIQGQCIQMHSELTGLI